MNYIRSSYIYVNIKFEGCFNAYDLNNMLSSHLHCYNDVTGCFVLLEQGVVTFMRPAEPEDQDF